jgi:hypothetical protein
VGARALLRDARPPSTRCGPAPSARTPTRRPRVKELGDARRSDPDPGDARDGRPRRRGVRRDADLVPGRWGGKPVTPSLLRWRVTTPGGRVLRGWRTAIDHRLVGPGRGLRDPVRPLDTSEQAESPRPLPLRPRAGLGRSLADGRYVVDVAASDVSGNWTVAVPDPDREQRRASPEPPSRARWRRPGSDRLAR